MFSELHFSFQLPIPTNVKCRIKFLCKWLIEKRSQIRLFDVFYITNEEVNYSYVQRCIQNPFVSLSYIIKIIGIYLRMTIINFFFHPHIKKYFLSITRPFLSNRANERLSTYNLSTTSSNNSKYYLFYAPTIYKII